MWLRPQIKKQDLFYWVQALVVLFYMLAAVGLFVTDRASYVDRLFSLKFVVPVYFFALVICYGAYRRWPVDPTKVSKGRT